MSIFDDELENDRVHYASLRAQAIPSDRRGRPPAPHRPPVIVELHSAEPDNLISPWHSNALEFHFKPLAVRILKANDKAAIINFLGVKLSEPLGAWVYDSPAPIPIDSHTFQVGRILTVTFAMHYTCMGIAFYGERVY